MGIQTQVKDATNPWKQWATSKESTTMDDRLKDPQTPFQLTEIQVDTDDMGNLSKKNDLKIHTKPVIHTVFITSTNSDAPLSVNPAP